MQVVRPHIEKRRPELESFIKANWDNQKVLAEVNFELQFRRKKSSVELMKRVSGRLQELVKESDDITVSFLHPNNDLLGHLGYRTGENRASESSRRSILKFVYTQPLPNGQPSSHLQLWGAPSTSIRLKKIAETLVVIARTAKGKHDERSRFSMAECEADLEYLKTMYYDFRKCEFTWPCI